MCLAWGDALTAVFNTAYRPLVRGGPDALGRPLAELWGEAWKLARPAVEHALAGGSGRIQDEDSWSFSYSPMRSDCGQVLGVLWVAQETVGGAEGQERAADLRRLRGVLSQAPAYTAFLSGPDHVYEFASRSYDELAGRPVKGLAVRDAFPDLDRRVYDLLDDVHRRGRPRSGRGVRLHAGRSSGPGRYFDYMLQPVRDDRGSVMGVFVVCHDVTDRVITDAEHRRREEGLRLAIDAGHLVVVEIDMRTRRVVDTPELRRLCGVPDEVPVTLELLEGLILPHELTRLHALVTEAWFRGERFFEVEYRYRRIQDGAVRWMLARGRPVQTGKAYKFLGVLMDVTERREAQERSMLLAREVDHRANNLLSTVQSIVALTSAQDIPDFREAVLGRILALAHTHRLLAASGWAGASLHRVVSDELRPFGTTDQIHIAGEDATLAPAVAQGVAVALHELATNAAKYGALSVQKGRVDVTWTRPPDQACVEISWREHGGPPVQPPSRTGFGANLLRRALSGPIGGSIELDWRPEGLCCKLRFPADDHARPHSCA